MEQREFEIRDVLARRRFVAMQSSIVRVWMVVPSTLPVVAVPRFEIVDREVIRREPPDIDSNRGH